MEGSVTKEGRSCFAGLSLLSLTALFVLSACTTLNDQSEQSKHWDVPHPGKYTLTYFTPGPYDMKGNIKIGVGERVFFVPEDTVRPSAQSMYLLSHWKVKEGEEVLDIGTGSGVQAVFAAEKASRVVATDIDQSAVDTATFNVDYNGFGSKVELRQGDLFEPIGAEERFDVILFNIVYPIGPDNEKLWEVHRRFFAEVGNHLKPGGRVYYQSGMVENIHIVSEMAEKNHLTIVSIRMDSAFKVSRQPIVFVMLRWKDVRWGIDAPDIDY